MTNEDFNQILQNRLQSIQDVLASKAEEYARADRLSNFKHAAVRLKCTPERALLGMMEKHSVALYDYITDLDRQKLMPLAQWDEKIGDMINYLILLETLVIERYTKKVDSTILGDK